MKTIFLSNRLKAIFGISVLAIGIGVFANKFINYPSCSKTPQTVSFIKKLMWITKKRYMFKSTTFEESSSWFLEREI